MYEDVEKFKGCQYFSLLCKCNWNFQPKREDWHQFSAPNFLHLAEDFQSKCFVLSFNLLLLKDSLMHKWYTSVKELLSFFYFVV